MRTIFHLPYHIVVIKIERLQVTTFSNVIGAQLKGNLPDNGNIKLFDFVEKKNKTNIKKTNTQSLWAKQD